MSPMAFIGPATSGFSTASLVQSGVTSTANYMYKKSTGKTFVEQAIITFNKNKKEVIVRSLQQAYLPKNIISGIKVAP
tara:strand:+ start:231 stop:464 length:234 start_codon:yes stop_codon:yes gene_type:complete